MTNNQSRQHLETVIIERATQDPTFRQALIRNPKAALANFLGMVLPPNIRFNVLEEQPGQNYLLLPPAPQTVEAMPLDDLELALVGGGRTLRPTATDCQMGDVRSQRGQRSGC